MPLAVSSTYVRRVVDACYKRELREHPELQNEPPLNGLELPTPNHFMASSSADPMERLAIKGV